jgi:hypothetical protein
VSDRLAEIENWLSSSESVAYVIDEETAADMRWLIQERYRLLSRIAYLEGWKQGAEEGYQKEREA